MKSTRCDGVINEYRNSFVTGSPYGGAAVAVVQLVGAAVIATQNAAIAFIGLTGFIAFLVWLAWIATVSLVLYERKVAQPAAE